MPLIRYIQKITRDPNFLVWRDTIYINADGRPQYLSLKLVSDIDSLLQGKISEYIFQSEFREVRFSCDEVKILGRNLVAEYLFYEGNGTTLHDTSGNNRNIIHDCTWGQLPNGKYYLIFDGTNAINTYKSLARMGVLSEYTFEFIYKRTGYSPEWIEVWVINPSVYYHDFIASPTGDTHYYQFYDGNWHRIYVSIPLNKWKHILFRARSNDNAQLYVNNTLINSINTNALGGFGNTWYIGGDWEHERYYVRMHLALIRIFNVKVSDTVHDKLWKLAQIAVPELA